MTFLTLLERWLVESPSVSPSANGSAKQTENLHTKKESTMGSTLFGRTSQPHGSESCLPAIAHLPETKRMVIAQALTNMLRPAGYLDICTINSILEILNQSQKTEAYKLLRTLHCVHYREMDASVRKALPALIREALQPPTETPVTNAILDGIVIK